MQLKKQLGNIFQFFSLLNCASSRKKQNKIYDYESSTDESDSRLEDSDYSDNSCDEKFKPKAARSG